MTKEGLIITHVTEVPPALQSNNPSDNKSKLSSTREKIEVYMNLKLNKEYVKENMKESSFKLKNDVLNILNLDNIRLVALNILRALYF